MLCLKCHKDKESSGFYKINKSSCKDCLKIYNNNYLKNWRKTPKGEKYLQRHNIYIKNYRLKNIKHFREYYRNWYKTNGRNRSVDYQEVITDWTKKNPEKVKARKLVGYAVKTGKIIKSKSCTLCNRETRLSGHHRDYAKPLEVIWLCSSCHKLEHINSST